MKQPMSNGDLERLHAAEAQALGVRNFYVREIRRLQAELASKQSMLGDADATWRRLRAQIEEETAPRLPVLEVA